MASSNSIAVSTLPEAANVAASDRFLILRDPDGTPSVRTIDFGVVCANLVLSNAAPANSSSNGIAGTVRYDSSFVYVCVANNTWTRTAIGTW